MKKLTILSLCFIAVVFFVFINTKTKRDDSGFEVLYGESEKWFVTANSYRTFQFVFKGNSEVLENDNEMNQISFTYGTESGDSTSTLNLNSTNYYQVNYPVDYITGLATPSNSRIPYVVVQISYGNTTDSVNLLPYRLQISD